MLVGLAASAIDIRRVQPTDLEALRFRLGSVDTEAVLDRRYRSWLQQWIPGFVPPAEMAPAAPDIQFTFRVGASAPPAVGTTAGMIGPMALSLDGDTVCLS